MRVVQIIDSLDVGGGEKMAVNLANLFEEKETPNLLVSTRKGGPLEVLLKNRDSLVLLEKKRTFDFSTFVKLLKKVREFKPTVVHAHDSSIFWAAVLAIFLPKTKVIWHAHYGGFSSENSRFGKKVRYFQKWIDAVVVVNSDLLEWVKNEFPQIRHSRFIGNFPEKISDASVDRSDLKWIICVANLKKPKNHINLVLAFSQVVQKYSEMRLALIGSCEDSKYLREVKDLIKNLQLEDKSEITGPIISLKKWFDKARFAVLSSDMEGLPVSVLELGLSKVPVLCSAVGACPDLLENGNCGYLANPYDVSSLSLQMLHMIENSDEAKSKSEHFQQKILDEYGGNNFFEEYSAMINRVRK